MFSALASSAEWLASYGMSHLGGNFAAYATVVVGLFALFRYIQSRSDDRAKHDDERFMKAATALASSTYSERMAGAVMLRTFLDGRSKRFRPMIFDYTAGLLRSRPEPKWQDPDPNQVQGHYQSPSEESIAFYQLLTPSFTKSAHFIHDDTELNPSLGLHARSCHLDWLRIDHANISNMCLTGSTLVESGIYRTKAVYTDWSQCLVHGASFHQVDVSHSRW
jgi:hypothetical protein